MSEVFVRDVLPWFTLTVDVADCSRVEFLTEGDGGCGIREDTWPHDVRFQMDAAVKRWIAENPEREIRARTTAAVNHPSGGRQCVVILHHAARTHGRSKGEDDGQDKAGAEGGTAGGGGPEEIQQG